ncbi:hypothetical protein [Anatilimnocola floriformis]|uniref:hypothetical protein n=1 Tax=Anatilimnocola floriformis TaxID=2948575 RepID=UPI0020C44DD0|nr:hypothetical protein [Anatilimnocola floriformis]
MPGTEVFDPYLQWLGIEPSARPANHYSLLGLQLFEGDPAKIAAAADERMGLIRQFQSGPRGMHTQRLLNELSVAKLCLLSEASKSAYDVELHRQMFPARSAPPLNAAAPLPRRAPVPYATPAPAPAAPARAAARPAVPAPAERRRIFTPFNIVFCGGLLVLIGGFGGYSLYQQKFAKVRQVAVETEEPEAAPKPKTKPKAKPTKPAKPAKPNPAASVAVVILQEGSGEVNLTPSTAQVTPNLVREVIGTQEVLSGWRSSEDVAEWQFKLVKPGFFELELQYFSESGISGQRVKVDWGANSQIVRLKNQIEVNRDRHAIVIQNDGQHTITVSPADKWPNDNFRLVSVRLIPGQSP